MPDSPEAETKLGMVDLAKALDNGGIIGFTQSFVEDLQKINPEIINNL